MRVRIKSHRVLSPTIRSNRVDNIDDNLPLGFNSMESIQYIFNKFSPIENGLLKERLEKLLTRCKFKSKGLFTMDGSRRSSHGNAYFAGIGGAKRIVLFDTLIEKLNEKEIEAVLAHEVGHYKCGHIPSRLIQSALMSFGFFFFLGLFIDEQLFFLSFGISIETMNLLENSGIF